MIRCTCTKPMEYKFEQLSIMVGAWCDGTAYLEPDRAGFRIASICLERQTGPASWEFKWLFRAGTALESEVRTAIEAVLYRSPHVRDAWAAHVEESKADAA